MKDIYTEFECKDTYDDHLFVSAYGDGMVYISADFGVELSRQQINELIIFLQAAAGA